MTTHIAQQSVTQFANPQDAIHHVLNQETQSATLNVKSQNVKLNALIRDVKCMTAQSVLLSANNPIVSPIAKRPSQNVKLSVKNPDVTGNATNPIAPSLSASLSVRTLIVFLRLIAALVLLEVLDYPKLLSHSLKKQKRTMNAVHALMELKTN